MYCDKVCNVRLILRSQAERGSVRIWMLVDTADDEDAMRDGAAA